MASASPPGPELAVRCLNGSFGALVEGSPPLTPETLRRRDVGERLRTLWARHGFIVVRGLHAMAPEDLAAVSGHFGTLSTDLGSGREHAALPSAPVMRIGNGRDESGRLIAVPSSTREEVLPASGSCRYRPADRRPRWHTDGTFMRNPPVGSAFFCRKAPPEGGATCFADTAAAWEALPPQQQRELEGVECVCSLAHHDKKVSLTIPGYPTLTPEERAANPPVRVPAVLEHPETGRRALYGMNSSTCCVVPRGTEFDPKDLDRFDLEGFEDPSVELLRDLLPLMTSPEFTVVWQWEEGDLVVWDNRSTIHAATGFDDERYIREMWRTSIVP